MKKLKNLIEKWVYEKLDRGITPYMVDVCIEIYNEMVNGEKPEFITTEICAVLDKCGIKYKPCGIGWRVI